MTAVAPERPSPSSGPAGNHSPAVPKADPGERHRLGVLGGLAALSLDALASVAYGPEAIVLVLALAGGAGLGLTVPVTVAIAVLLVVLTFSYRQIIATFPAGGGAYGVARAYLGRRAGLLAAASLIVDYVLNVAVSVAAGVAALTSAFPALLPWTLELALGVLLVIALVNLRGIAESARWFIGPTVVYVLALAAVIVVGLFRAVPAATLAEPAAPVSLQTVGLLLILRAFANGCAALTGVEAIANAVPAFKRPRVRRAQRTEVALGGLLAVLLLGIAALIEKFQIRPGGDATVLARVTAASLGDGWAFYVVQFATVVLLALAANTSFGGLPILASLLARDHHLPHLFALRANRQVYRYGVVVLTVLSAALLVATDGQVNALVPLFAIGVFVGFTLAQWGMVRHWRQYRPAGWRSRASLNGVGGLLTAVAAVVITATKFGEGAWLVVLVLPLFMLVFDRVHRAYTRIGDRLGLGSVPPAPRAQQRVVVVPVRGVDRLTARTLGAARSLGADVRAVHVCDPDQPSATRRLQQAWDDWAPGVPLVLLPACPRRRLDIPVLDYLDGLGRGVESALLIGEVDPAHWWARGLQNQRGAVLARAVRHRPDVVVCRLRFTI